MRLIGSILDERHARRLSAYLFTQGIQNHVDQTDQQFEIWVKDEDQLERSKTCFSEFIENPNDTKYRAAVDQADSLARQQEKKRLEIQKRVVRINPRQPGKRRQPLTLLLIGIAIFVALATNFGDSKSLDKPVFRALAFNGLTGEALEEELIASNGQVQEISRLASIRRGELWRLITPIFIHFSVMHILFNSIMLYQLGGRVENRYGTLWMAALVISSAIVSNLVQCLVPESVGGSVPTIINGVLLNLLGGLSGVVFAMFGFVWMKSLFDRSSGFYLPPSSVIIIMGYFFFCMLPGSGELLGGQVANWAHAGGLAVGMITGYWSTFVGKR